MRGVRRLLAIAAAAVVLALPIQALADGGSEGEITVEALLAGCTRSAESVSCTIAATFTTLEGASHYTATVTRPDGSVVPLGPVPAGAAALPVTYAGNGEYLVTVSAWGPGARKLGAASAPTG